MPKVAVLISQWQGPQFSSHIHLVVQVRHRRQLQKFVRVFPQRLMFQVTGARIGKPQGRVFDSIDYSRVVSWGREFKVLCDYSWKNEMEALGFPRGSCEYG